MIIIQQCKGRNTLESITEMDDSFVLSSSSETHTKVEGRINELSWRQRTNEQTNAVQALASFNLLHTDMYAGHGYIQGIIRTGYNNIIHPCQVELKGIRSDRDSSTFWQWQIYVFVRTNYSFYLRRRRSSFAWLFVRKVPWSFASRDVHLQTFISTALGFIFGKQLKMCAS